MISIQSSLTELERSHQLRADVLDCYLLAIKNIANYAVELDEEITAPHRKYLKYLAAEVPTDQPEALLASRATLRGLLRDYRDKAAANTLPACATNSPEPLARWRRSSTHSLNPTAITKSTCALRWRRLREAAALPAGGAIAPLVHAAANSIEQSIEQMRKQHQLTISQFMVEIRMLHKRIDCLEAAAATDRMHPLR